MRLLYGFWPRIDVTQLGEAAVEREGAGPGPRLLDEVVSLVVSRSHQRRRIAVAADIVHWRADRQPGDETTAADAVEQRILLGDAERRLVHGYGVAKNDDGSIRFAMCEDRGDQVRRHREPVAVLMMFVHAYAVEAELFGKQ